MNRTPPLSVPPLPNRHPSPRPLLPELPGSFCPAPHTLPLPCAIPHPAHLPPRRPARPALFFALFLSVSALAIDCAQLDLTASSDAGAAAAPSITAVSPAPGSIEAADQFVVTFSTPMDPSLLLSDVASSKTVVLVAQADAQIIAAALGHPTLTAAEEALLIPARATLSAESLSIALAPAAPLAPGSYVLLVSARLKSAASEKLEGGTAEFGYAVAAPPVLPALVDPLAGASAPLNLSRVRVSFSAGAPGSIVSLIGSEGLVAAAAAPAGPGEAVIALCPDPPCAALDAGASYTLALDGAPVPAASFTIDSCTRTAGPSLLASAVAPRDTSAALSVSLDWPARVLVQIVPTLAGADPGSPDDALDAGVAGAPCASTGCTLSALASCATAACTAVAAAGCDAQIALAPLAASTRYTVTLTLEDDEGNRAALPPLAFATLGALPAASIEEVMASPPLPAPRELGEYVEIENDGSGAINLSQLALQGADGVARPLLGAAPPAPVLLAPGAVALAVGASFDASRYPIPAGVPVLRAKTQELLAHGLDEETPKPFSLVLLPAGDSSSASAVLSTFPGGSFGCVEGASIDRVHPAPDAGAPAFSCGALGGSPGQAH